MRRVITIGWVVTALLSSVAPATRAVTGVSGSGKWPVLLAVDVGLVTLLAIRRHVSAMFLALLMSGSALASGGALGFAGLAIGMSRPGVWFFAVKWAAVGFLLTLLLIRTVRSAESEEARPARSEETSDEMRARLEAMTPEELQATIDNLNAEVDALIASSRQKFRLGVAVLLLGAAVLLSSVAVTTLHR